MIQGAAFRVLACFYDTDARSFAELCKDAGYPTDLGGYYIRQLVQGGYLEKSDRGQYTILPKGKQQLAFNYGKQLFAPKPRLMVLLIVQQGEKLVILRRSVQPFIGSAEWPAGAVGMGETMQDAAVRILEDRLGCKGEPQFVGFFRRTDMYDDTVFDDKLFAVHLVTVPEGTTIDASTQIGEITLCSEQDLSKLAKPAKSLLDIYQYSRSDGGQFQEHTYSIAAADLSA